MHQEINRSCRSLFSSRILFDLNSFLSLAVQVEHQQKRLFKLNHDF